MNVRRIGGGLAIVALGVGVAACGSSSSKSTTTATGLTRAQLVSQANTICATAQTASSAIKAPASLADATVAAKYFDQVAPITDTETQALKALVPASEAQADYAAFVAAQDGANTLLQTIRQKADTRDASGLQDLKQVPATSQRVAAAASKLGAATCAQ